MTIDSNYVIAPCEGENSIENMHKIVKKEEWKGEIQKSLFFWTLAQEKSRKKAWLLIYSII
jgi:hypothetical protein